MQQGASPLNKEHLYEQVANLLEGEILSVHATGNGCPANRRWRRDTG